MEMLVLNKPRLDFSEVFKPFIKIYQNEYHDIYSYESDYDEDYYDGDYLSYLEEAYGFTRISSTPFSCHNYSGRNGIRKVGASNSVAHPTRRGRGKGSKKRKSRARVSDAEIVSSYTDDNKYIYFYTDINNPDSYELFNSLVKFDDYLTSNGIQITDYEVQKILNRDVSHCFAQARDGELHLVSDHSYSGLYWESCESVDSTSGFWD